MDEKTHFWKGFLTGIGVLILLRLVLIAGLAAGIWATEGSLDKVTLLELAADKLGVSAETEDNPLLDLKEHVERYFILSYDEEEALTAAKKAYVEALDDPYSEYLTASEFENMMTSSDGAYCGIGVEVGQAVDSLELTVMTVFSGSPAEEAGIRPGDILKAAGGTDLTEMKIDEAVQYVKGPEGSFTELVLYRPDTEETLTVSVERRQVEIDTVEMRMLTETVGYIRLKEFDDVSVKQVKNALQTLSEQGMQELVFDLRDNPGGLLTSVVSICDLFLDEEQLIFYMQNKLGKTTKYYAEEEASFTGRMTVLVNGSSASASEVFTGAMKDHGRAVILGENTFGKGIVQSFYELDDGSALKLTSHDYYTPSGANIHGKGILPDIVLTDDPDTEADEVIDAALAELEKP